MTDDQPLAYVFWHWRQPEVEAAAYEARQRAFHRALSTAAPASFRGSRSFAVAGLPWIEGVASLAYEDWYVVDDFAALGTLNAAAVSGSVSAPHDAAAAPARGGAGGLYALRGGMPTDESGWACWLDKPAAVAYADFLADLLPPVRAARAALWQRQLVLGPAREFCIRASSRFEVPVEGEPLWVPLRRLWPSGPATDRS